MVKVVTLDLSDHAFVQSPGLLAEMEDGAAQITNVQAAVRQEATDLPLGGGFQKIDFRQHAQGVFDGVDFDGHSILPPANRPGHWLLGAVYGRDVLKQLLHMRHPELAISRWRTQPELDERLEGLIDVLGLRDLAAPRTLAERANYLTLMSRLVLSDVAEDSVCAA